ncbi:hypothetical protein EWM64_g4379 [Hericium alpestre]|uniref:Uncharacterized protein n=1 Tax=Hericium alpestre TaxID=135208 RepID=A0A4Y9ZZQ4_9AGAM|nr:hypothetical protein EWM64_g4379 [Hericium alpestre]
MTGAADSTTGPLLARRQVSPQESSRNGLAQIISLQKDRRDKPRRIFKPVNNGLLTSISLHGFVDSVETSSRRRRRTILIPSTPSGELIDDACMVSLPSGPHAILGHARERQQISLLRLSASDSQIHHYDKPKSAGMRSGVSAVCAMMTPLMFASGGHDHNVHLWQIKENSLAASATRLDIKHTSVVQSLVPIHDTSHKLISAGADCNVHLYDLSSERVVRTMKTSNSVYQMHVAASPYTVLLEVAHRELQFELRDYRVVPRNAVQRFGYHDPKVNGRFARGDLRENHFVCGDNDGRMDIFDGQKVVQVLFDESTFIAASEHNQLAFFANPIA